MGPITNVIELCRVRCLDCGTKYAKPADGGLIHQNPGCPCCGYVGWIDTAVPPSRAARRRFAVDRRPLRIAQPR